MSCFSANDLEQIEQLVFEPNLKPNFDAIKFCLMWQDEKPARISIEGYEKLCDLWIARSFIYHRKLPRERWGLDPDYFWTVWQTALNENIKWPGFRRINLLREDENFLNQQISIYSSNSAI